ncbi:MAG TPA: DUF1080 domain-containing protein [Verrucomicrobiae bacterium]|nr:DUF1080 domain-containing protein [Verrucomicrobiae bacterium]
MRLKISALGVLVFLFGFSAMAQSPNDKWLPNDMDRPMPPAITFSSAGVPSDAVVLFDGSNLNAWVGRGGSAPEWDIKDGALIVKPRTGSITTKQSFGDAQIHVEWAEPLPAMGDGQNKGNSGVIIMGVYEIQILDDINNKTYADGIAASVYGQYPPLVVAARNPGEWQTMDILFRRPRFDSTGRLITPAHITIIQNGVYVQDDVTVTGPTGEPRAPYVVGPEAAPLSLQDHGEPVRYRNLWIRPLAPREPDLSYTALTPYSHLNASDLPAYAGHYQVNENSSVDIQVSGNSLTAQVHGGFGGLGRGGRGGPAGRGRGAAGPTPQATAPTGPPPGFQLPAMPLVPVNKDMFINAHLAGYLLITFTRGADGQVNGLTMLQGNNYRYAQKAQ